MSVTEKLRTFAQTNQKLYQTDQKTQNENKL